MSALQKPTFFSIKDYLSREAEADQRHEYIAGYIYAMAGGAVEHSLIASNMLALIHLALRQGGGNCRSYNSDMKVRIRSAAGTRLYYPDLSVICEPNPRGSVFQDSPEVIFEVLSESTRRIDEGEKKDAYLSIPTLNAYVLVEQNTRSALVYRRGSTGFGTELVTGESSTLELPTIGVSLSLADIYEGVRFEDEE